MSRIYQQIEELRGRGQVSALCTVVSTKGSTPLKAGAKMLVWEDGGLSGTIGGGHLEKAVIRDAQKLLQQGGTRLFEHNLLQEHGMCCGGSVQVLIEAIRPPERLYIFGAGHVGRALAQLAESVDMEVFVVDPREEEMEKLDPKIKHRLNLPFSQILPKLPFNPQTFIAIMTYDHQLDREILAACIRRPHAYLGMIGSRRKVEVTKKMFLATGLYEQAEIDRVDMPMGYDLRGKGPMEIAIGIMAKIIETKNKHQTAAAASCTDGGPDLDAEKSMNEHGK